MNDTAYILFTRIPVPGRVKSRLLPRLSGEDCATLQKAMTLDTAHALAELPGDLFVFHSDEGPLTLLDGLPKQARCHPQSGTDLGQRMYRALETVLGQGYKSCLLLGSDLPLLMAREVAEAGRALEESDLVLCPSLDGGYWLVGMHTLFRPIFEDQKYGTDSVLNNAVVSCAAHGLKVGFGPARRDLDTPEDLNEILALPELYTASGRTAAWLRNLLKRESPAETRLEEPTKEKWK